MSDVHYHFAKRQQLMTGLKIKHSALLKQRKAYSVGSMLKLKNSFTCLLNQLNGSVILGGSLSCLNIISKDSRGLSLEGNVGS